MSADNILIIGNGSREEYMERAIRRTCKRDIVLTRIPYKDPGDVLATAEKLNARLTIIGPEQPLFDGVKNLLATRHLQCVGPTQEASMAEKSKKFLRATIDAINKRRPKHRRPILQPRWDAVYSLACGEYVVAHSSLPLVIKLDGPAAGKGVNIAYTPTEARTALTKAFAGGTTSQTVLIEEKLNGPESSLFYLCNGRDSRYFGTARDYKSLTADPKSPMTGGMGAYSPSDIVDDKMIARVEAEIVQPFLEYMDEQGIPYEGVLYVSLMFVKMPDGTIEPYVIEFNCRFGDPEMQALAERIESDFLACLCATTIPGALAHLLPIQFKEQKSVAVVLATKDYPAPSGKRVKTEVGMGDTYADAREKAYEKVHAENKQGQYYSRPDIAEEL